VPGDARRRVLEVEPHNPCWTRCARTFEDGDGYRVVIAQADWHNAPAR
jgi:hypothetical protein